MKKSKYRYNSVSTDVQSEQERGVRKNKTVAALAILCLIIISLGMLALIYIFQAKNFQSKLGSSNNFFITNCQNKTNRPFNNETAMIALKKVAMKTEANVMNHYSYSSLRNSINPTSSSGLRSFFQRFFKESLPNFFRRLKNIKCMEIHNKIFLKKEVGCTRPIASSPPSCVLYSSDCVTEAELEEIHSSNAALNKKSNDNKSHYYCLIKPSKPPPSTHLMIQHPACCNDEVVHEMMGKD